MTKPRSTLPLVKLVATGGTIAMRHDALSEGAVPALSGQELLAAVPQIADIARLDVDNFSNQPSDYIGPEDWRALYRRVTEWLACEAVAAVVISHGTDTLEETAFFLDLTLHITKPVILVGAQRSASALDSDGPRNLYNAVQVAIDKQAHHQGVLVVMNEHIMAARGVSKYHTTNTAGFHSGELGLLGEVCAGQVWFYRSPSLRQHLPLATQSSTALPRVDIVAMYAGADGALVQAAVAAGAQGIVIQGLGAGNVNKPLYQAIKQALAAGVTVVIASRVPEGRVMPNYAYVGGGQSLVTAGVLLAGDLSPPKARILLLLALQDSPDKGQVAAVFNELYSRGPDE